MQPPLKLNDIEQEHLQEVYESCGVHRDELPYTPAFEKLCAEFQDRTFKSAHPEQVFGALLKYGRASAVASVASEPPEGLTEDHLKQLKILLTKMGAKAKLLPYSDEFASVKKEFGKQSGLKLEDGVFWKACTKTGGPKRQPPKRKKAAVSSEDDE